MRRNKQRDAFVADARESRAEFVRTGVSYDAHEVHAYFRTLAAGKNVPRPQPKRRDR